jgi:hypothetical protein
MKKILVILLITVTLSCITIASATANTIYSTFGPGDTYGDVVWPVGDYVAGSNYNLSIVTPFTPTEEGYVESLEIAASYRYGTNNLTIDLTTDNAGLPSSTILDSFSFLDIDPRPGGIYSQASLLKPLLFSTDQYWLVATVELGSLIGWYLNDIGATGVDAYELVTGTWVGTTEDTAPAFRLNGTPVPEPSTFLLLGGGLAGLAFVVRRKRKD